MGKKITLKVSLNTAISHEDAINLLYLVFYRGGTVWMQDLLREEKISGRTGFVDSFRFGRSDTEREKTCEELLERRPLTYWFAKYFENFSIGSIFYGYYHQSLDPIEIEILVRRENDA